MGRLDRPLRKVAQTVLAKFGTDVTFTSQATGGYDPATGTVSTASPATSYTVKGRLDEYLARELNDTIKVGDRRLTIAAADVDAQPDVDDAVTVAGLAYDIVRVENVMGTDENAYYVLQLRR